MGFVALCQKLNIHQQVDPSATLLSLIESLPLKGQDVEITLVSSTLGGKATLNIECDFGISSMRSCFVEILIRLAREKHAVYGENPTFAITIDEYLHNSKSAFVDLAENVFERNFYTNYGFSCGPGRSERDAAELSLRLPAKILEEYSMEELEKHLVEFSEKAQKLSDQITYGWLFDAESDGEACEHPTEAQGACYEGKDCRVNFEEITLFGVDGYRYSFRMDEGVSETRYALSHSIGQNLPMWIDRFAEIFSISSVCLYEYEDIINVNKPLSIHLPPEPRKRDVDFYDFSTDRTEEELRNRAELISGFLREAQAACVGNEYGDDTDGYYHNDMYVDPQWNPVSDNSVACLINNNEYTRLNLVDTFESIYRPRMIHFQEDYGIKINLPPEGQGKRFNLKLGGGGYGHYSRNGFHDNPHLSYIFEHKEDFWTRIGWEQRDVGSRAMLESYGKHQHRLHGILKTTNAMLSDCHVSATRCRAFDNDVIVQPDLSKVAIHTGLSDSAMKTTTLRQYIENGHAIQKITLDAEEDIKTAVTRIKAGSENEALHRKFKGQSKELRKHLAAMGITVSAGQANDLIGKINLKSNWATLVGGLKNTG